MNNTAYINNWETQLRKGLLDIAVMNILTHGSYHGYDLVQKLKRLEGMKIREGNVYPILSRLKQEKLVKTYKRLSQDGPPRNYFELTEQGKEALAQMNSHWQQIIKSISTIQTGDFE